MKILGINISHHGSSCLLEDGEIKYFLEDERINRIKHYIPNGRDMRQSIKDGSLEIYFTEELLKYTDHVDYIIFSSFGRYGDVIYDDDDTLIDLYLRRLEEIGFRWGEVVFENHNHHVYHAANGFYGSEFDEAVALVLDGGGGLYPSEDNIDDLLGKDSPNCFREMESIFKLSYESGIETVWQHYGWNEGDPESANVREGEQFVCAYGDSVLSNTLSCGQLFNIFSWRLGFEDGSDAGKVMGLSSYYDIDDIVESGWWRNIDWFETMEGVRVTSEDLHQNLLVDNPFSFDREDFEPQTFYTKANIANKLQEETLNHTKNLINKAVELTGCNNVVLSGGYALNCLNNYQYLDSNINLFVDPISNDAGTALGAAKWLYYKLTESKEKNPLKTLYLS